MQIKLDSVDVSVPAVTAAQEAMTDMPPRSEEVTIQTILFSVCLPACLSVCLQLQSGQPFGSVCDYHVLI